MGHQSAIFHPLKLWGARAVAWRHLIVRGNFGLMDSVLPRHVEVGMEIETRGALHPVDRDIGADRRAPGGRKDPYS